MEENTVDIEEVKDMEEGKATSHDHVLYTAIDDVGLDCLDLDVDTSEPGFGKLTSVNDLSDEELERKIGCCEKLLEKVDAKLIRQYEELRSQAKGFKVNKDSIALHDSLLLLTTEELKLISDKVKILEQNLVELMNLDAENTSATSTHRQHHHLAPGVTNGNPHTPEKILQSSKSISRGIRTNIRLRAKISLSKAAPLRQTVDELLLGRSLNMKPLKVFSATWNVGNRAPSLADLQHILPLNGESINYTSEINSEINNKDHNSNEEKRADDVLKQTHAGSRRPRRGPSCSADDSFVYDIVVFGLQECEYPLSEEMKKTAVAEQRAKREDKTLYQKMNTEYEKTRISLKERIKVAIKRIIPGVYSEEQPPAPKSSEYRSSNYVTFSHGYNKTRMNIENTLKSKVLTSYAGMHVLSMIREVLGPNYALLRVSELAQMRLFVLVRKVHLHAVEHVIYSSEATGVAHIGTNKGGVGVSFSMYGLKLAWISCHLAAHKKYFRARGENLKEIFDNFDKKFGRKGFNMVSEYDHIFVLGDLNYRLDVSYNEQYSLKTIKTESILSNSVSGNEESMRLGYIDDADDYSTDSELEFPEHDIDGLIDMIVSESEENREAAIQKRSKTKCTDPSNRTRNTGYLSNDKQSSPRSRIQQRQTEHRNADATVHEWNLVTRLVTEKCWAEVREIDQLYNEQKEGNALFGFEEGVYDFLPTFKVQRDIQETVFVEKRTPSYTDRILWYSCPGRKSAIKQLHLTSVPKAITSDHKPVTASFEIQKNKLKEANVDDITPPQSFEHTDLTDKIEDKNMQNPTKIAEPLEGSSLYELGKNFLKQKISEHRSSSKGKKSSNARKKRWKNQTPFRINIMNLEASYLLAADLGVSSDPYCVICSPNLFDLGSVGTSPYTGIARTKTVTKDLNPKWKDFFVSFKCSKALTSVEYLSGRCVIFALWDQDHSRPDKLGQAIFDLNPLVDSYIFEAATKSESKRRKQGLDSLENLTEVDRVVLGTCDDVCSNKISFCLPVIFKGCKHGEIKGDIQIVGDRKEKQLRRRDTTATGSGGHKPYCLPCTIF